MIDFKTPDGRIDPRWLDSVHHVTYDARGCIVGAGSSSTANVLAKRDDGFNVVIVPTPMDKDNTTTHYIDLSGAEPLVKTRPVMDWTFDKLQVAPMQEATLTNVPPGIAIFTGPTKGEQVHAAFGPLKMGWTLPGTYVVTVKAFPYKDATFTLKVKVL